MSRTFIAAAIGILVVAAVGALYWYSHTVAAAIGSGGPVPLRSIAPPPSRPSPTPQVRATAAAPVVRSSPVAAASTAPVQSSGPKIVGVSLSTSVASGGQVVTGTVSTSPDVTSVQASIAGYGSALTRVSTGYFALSYRVPQLPAFLHRTYTIVVVARNALGQTASSSLPITVR